MAAIATAYTPTGTFGAFPLKEGGARFCVWAPEANSVQVVVYDDLSPDKPYIQDMTKDEDGCFKTVVQHAASGASSTHHLSSLSHVHA